MLISQILLSKQLGALRSGGKKKTAPMKVLFQPADGNPSLIAPLNAFGAVKEEQSIMN